MNAQGLRPLWVRTVLYHIQRKGSISDLLVDKIIPIRFKRSNHEKSICNMYNQQLS